jgi:hypothetical protein
MNKRVYPKNANYCVYRVNPNNKCIAYEAAWAWTEAFDDACWIAYELAVEHSEHFSVHSRSNRRNVCWTTHPPRE